MSRAAAALPAGRALAGGSAADPADPADPVEPVGRGAVVRQAIAAGMGSAASATRLVARTLVRRHGEPLQVPA